MPVILWIGVRPGTLTDEDGASLPAAGIVALACKRALEKHNILDVECEIKECNVYRGAGPVLARPSTSWDPTEAVDIEVFFTPTIGTCIAPERIKQGKEPSAFTSRSRSTQERCMVSPVDTFSSLLSSRKTRRTITTI